MYPILECKSSLSSTCIVVLTDNTHEIKVITLNKLHGFQSKLQQEI